MSDPFIGQIFGFAGNFAPRGYALCEGQLLAISSHTALFSILGTTYGGDGRSTFALPDLRGRAIVHPGSGPGLSAIQLGQRGGAENVNISEAQMPSHSHVGTLHAENKAGTSADPTGNHLARAGHDTIYAAVDAKDDVAMHSGSIVVEATGSGAPVPNVSPGLGMNMIIALDGTYPSRS